MPAQLKSSPCSAFKHHFTLPVKAGIMTGWQHDAALHALLNLGSKGVTQMLVTIINLILTTIILILGISAFFKRKSDIAAGSSKAIAIPDVALYIGISFGLFAVSHVLTLAGLAASLEVFIISIRVIAYLLVIAALCRILMKK
jgi:hypothetical protein